MIRTQIYLSKADKKALKELAAATGENVSELIRQAVGQFVASQHKNAKKRRAERKKALDAAFGMWRDNPFDFEALRRSANRKFS